MRKIAFLLSLMLIFIIPWEGVVRLPIGTLAKAIGLGVGAFWLATVVATGQVRKPTPYHLMVFLFVIWNAVSVFWSANPTRTLGHVMTWIQLFLLIYILWDLYTTREALFAGLQAYILGAYVAFGSAVYNYFTGNVFYTNDQRFSSGDTNPDGFGFILALGVPVAWYLASLASTERASRFWRLVNYAYIPAAFFGIALSGTRTALIASIIGTAFGLALLTRLRLVARLAIFIIIASAILILLPQVQTLKSFQRLGTTGTELTEGDLNNRTNNWREGLTSFMEHPLLGVGGNMYRSVNNFAKDNSGKVGHNSYLSVLVELGLIGFLLFGLILINVLMQARRQPKWEAWFWLTVLAVWGTGAFTLTWETRKSTWLFLTFVIVSAALSSQRYEATELVRNPENESQAIAQGRKLPQGAKEKSYSV